MQRNKEQLHTVFAEVSVSHHLVYSQVELHVLLATQQLQLFLKTNLLTIEMKTRKQWKTTIKCQMKCK